MAIEKFIKMTTEQLITLTMKKFITLTIEQFIALPVTICFPLISFLLYIFSLAHEKLMEDKQVMKFVPKGRPENIFRRVRELGVPQSSDTQPRCH